VVPPWLHGTWIRRNRSFDGGPAGECSDVAWLQVGPWFADLRIPRPGQRADHPFDQARAFSGRFEVIEAHSRAATVAWHHDIDTETTAGSEPDTAVVALRHGILVESGTGYTETWGHPEGEGSSGVVLVQQARTTPAGTEDPSDQSADGSQTTARVVCVGTTAIAVWREPRPGGARFKGFPWWEPTHVVGSLPPPSDLLVALRQAGSGQPLPGRWRQQVGPGW
jgi:hypothetical protein